MKCMLAQNLRKFREAKHYSRQQMAVFLGVTTVTYGNYETGAREPNLLTLMLLANKLDVTTDELLGFKSDVIKMPHDKYNDDNFLVVREAIERAGFRILEDETGCFDAGYIPKMKVWREGKLIAEDDWYHMNLMINRLISDAYNKINATVTKQIEMLYNKEMFYKEDTPEKWHLWRLMVDYDFLFADSEAPFADDVLPIIEGRAHNPFTQNARVENAEAWAKYVKRHDIDAIHI